MKALVIYDSTSRIWNIIYGEATADILWKTIFIQRIKS